MDMNTFHKAYRRWLLWRLRRIQTRVTVTDRWELEPWMPRTLTGIQAGDLLVTTIHDGYPAPPGWTEAEPDSNGNRWAWKCATAEDWRPFPFRDGDVISEW